MNATCQFISYDNQASLDNETNNAIRIIFTVYRQFYAYFVLAFGPINIVANLLSMFILTRKELRGSYSYLFFFMTLDHTIVVIFLVISVIRTTFTPTCDPANNTLGLAVFSIVSQNAMDILRAHASWLAVVIASLRFFAIRRRGFLEPSLRTILIWCCLSLAVLLGASTPVFMSTSIQYVPLSKVCYWRNFTTADDVIVATVRESEWVYYHDCLLLRVTYFISGTLHNGIPCILLFFLSVMLLRQLRVIRKEFMSDSKKNSDKSSVNDRVTKMMMIILITTIISEMPQSILNILVAFMPSGFRANIVDRLGNILMTIMLITSACNLFIYLSMSRKFKEVAKRYFYRAVPVKFGRFSTILTTKSSVRT